MEFQNTFLHCKVHFLDNKQIKIEGTVYNRQLYKNVLLIAPNSANKTASYSGTGLPFPCADIAFEGSPNIFSVGYEGFINTVFTYPNSYYTVANKKKIVSSIFVVIEHQDNRTEYIRLQLKDLYPLRTLVDREAKQVNGPDFYDLKHEILPVDNAEAVMKAYADAKIRFDIG
jgi:hypothetical protein